LFCIQDEARRLQIRRAARQAHRRAAVALAAA
jgi:hypothetical protein